MSEDADDLTIPAAAAVLGVHERRLRRLLERPEYADRTRQVTRRTRTGTRTAAALPSALVADLRARIEIEANAANADADNDGGNADNAAPNTDRRGGAGTIPPSALVALYEQRLQDKDRLIAAKDETIAELKASLLHERESHQRTQALVAMGQIGAKPNAANGDGDNVDSAEFADTPPVAQNRPETGDSAEEDKLPAEPLRSFHPTAEAEPVSVEESQKGFQGFSPVRDGERDDRETKRVGWWARLIGKGK